MKKRLFSLFCLLGAVSELFAGDTEKENVCVGISFPRINKNGAEKIFNAIDFLCLCGIVQCVSDAA